MCHVAYTITLIYPRRFAIIHPHLIILVPYNTMRSSITRVIQTQPSFLRSITTTARHASPPRPPVKSDRPQPTVFSNKSAPQQIHDRPEMIRGMPAGSTPSWAKGGGPIPKYVRVEKGDDFAGPSKPRLVYERPGERDLPNLKVRHLF
jgi:cytochrome c oxidase assembly factor 1